MNTIRTWLYTFDKFSPCPLMWSNSLIKNNSEEPFRTQVQKNICKLPNSPINRVGLLVKIAGSICDLILPISHLLSKRIILSVSNRCVCKLTVFCFIFSLRKWAEISVFKAGMTNNLSSCTCTFVADDTFAFSVQYFRSHNTLNPLFSGGRASAGPGSGAPPSGAKTVGRWLKDRKEKRKEETRAQNAQLHAAVSVAAVASAIAAIAAATASSASGKNEQLTKTDMAVASAATLVAAQFVEAAEAMGAERDHLASVVTSAVNVHSHDDITTLTAAAATGNDFSLYVYDNFLQVFLQTVRF